MARPCRRHRAWGQHPVAGASQPRHQGISTARSCCGCVGAHRLKGHCRAGNGGECSVYGQTGLVVTAWGR
eukprot:39607-Pyramimonas_sp.AAC.1